MKIGIIGGSRGLGKFFFEYFKKNNFEVFFSSTKKPKKNIKNWTSSNKELVKKCDIIFLSVPISYMENCLEEIFLELNNKTLIEVCSVKKFIVDKYLKLEKKNIKNINCDFISLHPMFGETTNKLENKIFIENYFKNKTSKNYNLVKKIFLKEKAKFVKLEYIKHDKIMAYIQCHFHLNIFISSSIISKSKISLNDFKKFSSPNYRIFNVIISRYILQNPKLYFEIQTFNYFSKNIIDELEKELIDFKKIILKNDEKSFIKKIEKIKKYYLNQDYKKEYKISEDLINQL